MALVFPSSPTTGQIFSPGPGLPTWMWDGSKWTNATTPPLHLASLSDVVLTSPANGQALSYDGTEWVNSNGLRTPFNLSDASTGNSLFSVATLTGLAANQSVVSMQGGDSTRRTLTVTQNGVQVLIVGGTGTVATAMPNATGLGVYGSPGTTQAGVYALNVQNRPPPAGSPAGFNNGLYISASSLNSENALVVVSQTGTGLFQVTGNGYCYMPSLTSSAAGSGSVLMGLGANNDIRWTASAARFKQDIRSVQRSRAQEIIAKLRTVSFRSKCDGEDPDTTYYGLIAEEVAAVDPGLVGYRNGEPMSVAYDRIAMLLLPLVQEILGMDEPEGEVYG